MTPSDPMREALEAALAVVDELYRKYGTEIDDADAVIVQHARQALSAPVQPVKIDREAIRGPIKDLINAHVSQCLRLGAVLHPGPTADAILSLFQPEKSDPLYNEGLG